MYKITGNWRGNHPTGCSGTRCQTVYAAQHIRTRGRFFDQDQEKRVQDDGQEIADCQADIYSRQEHPIRHIYETRDDKIRDRVKRSNEDKKPKDANLLRGKGEHDNLNEKCDPTIDSQYHADRLHGKPQSAWRVERVKSGSKQVAKIRLLVLEEDGH
ncbi:hypothetical protein RRF57_010430 [Xylaria bambusicola]|uniref:Uncharacterized protein n=1 Tax=Xylaria bambusicola TaxID=326684 RepID=A0AAN7Z9H9_9PEZI